MAKSMARLDENSIVINIEWMSDNTNETNNLININDCQIMIDDIYKNGKFYRNGKEILSPLEEAYSVIDDFVKKEEELITSYNEGVNSI
jgi:hypothetical protein